MDNLVKYENRTNCELRSDPACKAHWQKLVRLKDHETDLGEFDVNYCPTCKLGFTNPFPTEETVGNLYHINENSDFDRIRNSPIDTIKDFLSRRFLKKVAPKTKINAILDYATGNGRFAVSAKKLFPDARVDAVDYQSDTPPLLRQESNGVKYISVMDFASMDQKYDLIVMRHVLEHTHHPVALIKKLGSHLSENGILYIEVPNLESGCAQFFKKNWKGYYVPRHIFHFTTSSLAEVADKAGLDAVIGRNEQPFMRSTISILSGVKSTGFFIQVFGILLHPVQLVIEKMYGSSTCINATCSVKKK